MKLIFAIIQPTKLRAVLEALKLIGVERMTVCDAQGFGRQHGQIETFRGHQYTVNLLRKVCLEIAVHDDSMERVMETITQIARTGEDGNIGDGKIFMMPIEETIRLGETVRGPEAI